MDIEIVWKNKEKSTNFEEIDKWDLHDEKDLLVIEEFEDVKHYLSLDLIEGFTVKDD